MFVLRRSIDLPAGKAHLERQVDSCSIDGFGLGNGKSAGCGGLKSPSTYMKYHPLDRIESQRATLSQPASDCKLWTGY